jgi:hypothetical protein
VPANIFAMLANIVLCRLIFSHAGKYWAVPANIFAMLANILAHLANNNCASMAKY